MQIGLCLGAAFVWVEEKRARPGAREDISSGSVSLLQCAVFQIIPCHCGGFFCLYCVVVVIVDVSLPFVVNRDLTLKRWSRGLPWQSSS